MHSRRKLKKPFFWGTFFIEIRRPAGWREQKGPFTGIIKVLGFQKNVNGDVKDCQTQIMQQT